MAFPSSTGTKKDSLSEGWRAARNLAANVKNRAQAVRAFSQDGVLTGFHIIEFSSLLAGAKDSWNEIKAIPGMGQYAKDQVGDAALDIVAEFNAMLAAVDSVLSWIVANVPNDGTYILIVTLGSDGRYAYRTFTAGQSSGLRAALDTLIAAID